jgi:hypothetical protein
MNAEKAQIVCQQLEIQMMPTLILCKNKRIHSQIRGLDRFNPQGLLRLPDVEKVFYEMGFLEEQTLNTEEGMQSIRDAFQTADIEDDDSGDLLDL